MMSYPRRGLLFDEYYYLWNYPFTKSMHTHPFYEIYYFHSGKCRYQIGKEIFELQPGSLIILDGLAPHGPIVDRRNEYVRSMFTFHPSIVKLVRREQLMLDPLRPFDVLRHHHIRLQGALKADFEEHLQRLNHHYGKPNLIDLQRLMLCFLDLLMFIYECCMDQMEAAEVVKTSKEEKVKAVTSIIEKHYDEQINLEYMEKKLHVNKSYLARIFRELTGMTIIDYLYKHRIHQAKLVLFQHRTMAVTEVCRKVGFKHLSHFSRLFKQMVGMSPEQYRNYLRTGVVS